MRKPLVAVLSFRKFAEMRYSCLLTILLIFSVLSTGLVILVCYARTWSFMKPQPCPSQGVLTMIEPTRLEDAIWGYTTLLGFRVHGLTDKTILVPQKLRRLLNLYFYSLSIVDFDEHLLCETFLSDLDPVKPRQVKDLLLNTSVSNIIVDFTENPLEYTEPIWYTNKTLWDFEVYLSSVWDAELFINSTMNLLDLSSDMSKVCVWVSSKEEFDVYNLSAPFRKQFFFEAMGDFRLLYGSVLFVVIGDLHFARTFIRGNDVAFFRYPDVEHIMAMISLCNHTIADGSLLSLWAAFRAVGAKYVYGLPPELHRVLDLMGNWYVWSDYRLDKEDQKIPHRNG